MSQERAADRLQAHGDVRRKALSACQEQLRAWHVTLPRAQPLVLDFGLGEFERTGLIEYWITNDEHAGYCGKYLFNFAGQNCPAHSHKIKHETFFLLHGRMRVTLDGKASVLEPGQVLPIAPGRVHGFGGEGGPCLMLELSTPGIVADNYFVEPRVTDWLKSALAPLAAKG